MTRSRREFLHVGSLQMGTLLAATSTGLGNAAFVGQQEKPSSGDKRETIKAFFKAVGEGRLAEVQRLVTQDQSLLKTHDENGRSGYAFALLSGHGAVAQFLTRAGYESDLHEAALALDWKRFEQLATTDDDASTQRVNDYHPIGGSAMYAAAAGGAGTDIWRVYAQAGVPNVAIKPSRQTALQAALQFKEPERALLTAFTLLANGADPNASAPQYHPPLHMAISRKMPNIVEMLIRLGASLDSTGPDGKTAMDVATKTGHQDLIDMVSEKRLIPRTFQAFRASQTQDGKRYVEPNWEGLSQMERGSVVGMSHGNATGVKKMLDRDARFAHSVSTTSEKAVEAGAHMGNQRIVEMLLEAGAPYSLPTAVMMGDMQTAKRYLDLAPRRIHERGAHDFALLWYPIIGRGDVDMLELLIERGADVEQQSQMGTTALHWACRFSDAKMVEVLLAHGADPTRAGRKFGGQLQTPLQLTTSQKIRGMLNSEIKARKRG